MGDTVFDLEVLGLLDPVAVGQVEEDWVGERDWDTLPVPHTVGVRVVLGQGVTVPVRVGVLVPHPVAVTDTVGVGEAEKEEVGDRGGEREGDTVLVTLNVSELDTVVEGVVQGEALLEGVKLKLTVPQEVGV